MQLGLCQTGPDESALEWALSRLKESALHRLYRSSPALDRLYEARDHSVAPSTPPTRSLHELPGISG